MKNALRYTSVSWLESQQSTGSYVFTYLGEVVLKLLPESAHVLVVEFSESCLYDLPVPHLKTTKKNFTRADRNSEYGMVCRIVGVRYVRDGGWICA